MERTIRAVRGPLLAALPALMAGRASLPDTTAYQDASLRPRSAALADAGPGGGRAQ